MFVLAAPGVAPSAGAASQRTMTGVRSTMPDTGFTFGGMRARNNSIQIDGMDNRDETTGGNRVAVGLEMVQEFRVSGTAVGAELGGAAGGVLNMVTRSGVNIWHGDVTWFMQNEALNATRSEVDQPIKPRFRRYQPGASGMGPLRRDRTFIAAAVELEDESGDEFSNMPPEVEDLLKASPLARRIGVSRSLYGTSTHGGELSTKLDHQLGAADTLSARYAFSRGRVNGEVQGSPNFADRSAQGSSLTSDHSLVTSWMRVLSPTQVNDVRIQVAQRSMILRPNSRGPMFEIPGAVTFGQSFNMDGDRTERHFQVVENFQFVSGGHRFSAGLDLHSVFLDSSLRNRYAGLYVFPTVEAFLAGRPDMFVQAFGDPRTNMRTLPVGLWLQDRWNLKEGLTVELGFRYDHQVMPAHLPRSSQNAAPRIGLAWRPFRSRPLVFRAGTGLFYDRYPLAFLNEAVQKNGTRSFEQYLFGAPAAMMFLRSGGEVLNEHL
jgi:outer membrane receptor protein involved in Fe transport